MAGKNDVLSEDDNDDQVAAVETDVEIKPEEVEKEAKEADKEAVDVVEDEKIAQDDTQDVSADTKDDKTVERHKESAKERRDRARAAKERDKKELRLQHKLILDLQSQVETLYKKQNETQVTVLDDRLAAALNEVEQFQTIEKNATKAADHDAVFEARRLADIAKKRAEGLLAEKEQAKQAPATPPQQLIPDARIAPFRSIFLERHPWYNPASGDVDSAVVMALDQQVVREGYRPDSPHYWQALESKIAATLPKRAAQGVVQTDDGEDTDEEETVQPVKRGPPVGGTKQQSTPKTNTIRLNADRVAALKEAGLWDNPKDRERLAKKYATWDKNNRSA